MVNRRSEDRMVGRSEGWLVGQSERGTVEWSDGRSKHSSSTQPVQRDKKLFRSFFLSFVGGECDCLLFSRGENATSSTCLSHMAAHHIGTDQIVNILCFYGNLS